MKKQDVALLLDEFGACSSARDLFDQQPGTVKQAYLNCESLTWLAWIYNELGLINECQERQKKAKEEFIEYVTGQTAIRPNQLKTCKLPWKMVHDAIVLLINEPNST